MSTEPLMDDEVKLLPCGVTDEDHSWLRREIWCRRHGGFEEDAQRLERMRDALLTRPTIVTDVERVKLEFYRDYTLSVGYGLSENGRDHAVRDEHFRAAADEFADRLIAALPTIDQDGGVGGLANIEGGQIVIRVPIEKMQYAACGGMDQCNVEVTDDLQAAKGVVRYLNREDEEGSTLVHFALDKALQLAVENGEDGFAEPPAQPENDQYQD